MAGETAADPTDSQLSMPEMRDPEHMGGRMHAPLPGLEVYDEMRRTRVLFSFGSRYGGLHLAKRLRTRLLADLQGEGWTKEHVYIDAVSLTQDTPGAFWPDEGSPSFMLNHHWAEYYTMGVLVCHTLVLVLDAAWLDSVRGAGLVVPSILNL